MTRPPRFPIIGIAGGIGAGKSEVARMFGALRCAVVDSDALGKQALQEPSVRATLTGWWGPSILGPGGAVDRAKVAGIVFADPAERTRLEGLIHPLIAHARRETFESAARAGMVAGVIDAPLLFEVGLDRECDAVVFVDAPREQRLARVIRSRGWTDDELARREASQWPLEEKRKRCAYCLINHADRADVLEQVRSTLAAVLAAHPA